MLAAIQIYRTSDFYLRQMLNGLSETALRRRIGLANSIIWTAGHVTVGRLRILRELGEEGDIPWSDVFGKGASESTSTVFPPIEHVVERWNDAAPRLHARLGSLEESELERDVQFALPEADRTLGGMIVFFAYHEAYHIGQIAALRKVLDIAPKRRTADRLLADAALVLD